MEEETKAPKLKGRQKSPNHGGKRTSAGRKPGSKQILSVNSILEALEKQTGGAEYADILISDFLEARNRSDHQLIMKYHQLILQKVLVSVSRIELTENQDVVEAKKLAFAEALAKLATTNKD